MPTTAGAGGKQKEATRRSGIEFAFLSPIPSPLCSTGNAQRWQPASLPPSSPPLLHRLSIAPPPHLSTIATAHLLPPPLRCSKCCPRPPARCRPQYTPLALRRPSRQPSQPPPVDSHTTAAHSAMPPPTPHPTARSRPSRPPSLRHPSDGTAQWRNPTLRTAGGGRAPSPRRKLMPVQQSMQREAGAAGTRRPRRWRRSTRKGRGRSERRGRRSSERGASGTSGSGNAESRRMLVACTTTPRASNNSLRPPHSRTAAHAAELASSIASRSCACRRIDLPADRQTTTRPTRPARAKQPCPSTRKLERCTPKNHPLYPPSSSPPLAGCRGRVGWS